MARKRNELNVSPTAAAPARRAPQRRPRRAAKASPAVESQPANAAPAVPPSRIEIAQLAYTYWENRGCQGSSPEEDWLRAEQELLSRAKAAAA
jgi:hypothetical protein